MVSSSFSFFSFHVEALFVSFGALAQRLDDEKWRHCFHVEIQYFQKMNDDIAGINTFRQTLSTHLCLFRIVLSSLHETNPSS